MNAYEKFEFNIKDGVGTIVLNDAAGNNTVDLRFTIEFADIARRCEADESLKLLVLKARGEVFSYGGDLNEFIENKSDIRSHVRQMTTGFHQAILTFKRIAAPMIAVVDGMAAGGGFSLVCMADYVIATNNARFNFAYTRSGLTPDGGSTYFLPRIVGTQKAFDLMATNPTLSAQDAHKLGIVSRVVEPEELDSEIERSATSMMGLPSTALAGLKRLLWQSTTSSLEQQFEAEAQSISEIAASDATLARLESFLKR